MSTKDDESDLDDSVGRQSPLSPEPPEKPIVRSRPSFITNREYVSSLMVFVTFTGVVLAAQWLITKNPQIGFVVAVVVLALLCEWERRARYSFGRVRMRAHFDPLNLVKLPSPQFRTDIEMEPLTPYIPHETTRSDEADVLKRAKDVIGGQVEGGNQSSLELALIKLLKEGADKSMAGGKEKSASDTKDGNPDDKGPQPGPSEGEKGSKPPEAPQDQDDQPM